VADGARLDTATAGVQRLSVTATDLVGNERTVDREYVVVGTLPKARLTPRGVRRVLTSGLKVDLRAAFPTRMRVTGTLRPARGGPVVAVRAVTIDVPAGRTRAVVLRVSPAGASALRAAGAGALVATLRVRQQAGALTRTDTVRLPASA
jgi:hypothetical protein